jgi:hypothetical protein
VAAHLLKAPARADRLAVQRLRRVASVATARGSAEAALAYLRRCLDEDLDPPVRAAVLTEAAELAVRVDLPAAVGLLDEAVRSSTDPVAAARAGPAGRQRARLPARPGGRVRGAGRGP